MRFLAALMAVAALLVAPSTADAASLTGTRTGLVAASNGGLTGFRIYRAEERAHGYVLASGHVSLQFRLAGQRRWSDLRGSRTLAYKGRAMLFYRTPRKRLEVRAVSRDPGYRVSYSKTIAFPLR